MTWTELLVPALFGVGGGGGVWLGLKIIPEIRQIKSSTGKTDVDASKVIADTALELLTPLRERIAELEGRVGDCVTKLEDYEHHYGPLTPSQRAWRNTA